MMKTPMGIAAKNLTASDDESLMPDPVNAWTRPAAACDDRPLRGSQIRTPELRPVEPNRRCHRAHANQKGRLEPPEPFAQGTVNLIAKAPRYDNTYRHR
jgi:hypothetical protein